MNVEIDLRGRVVRRDVTHAFETVEQLHRGFAAFQISKRTQDKKYFRFAAALKQFRRSFQSFSDVDRVLFLQTAFESLLIDTMTSNKRGTMIERVWLALRGSKYTKKTLELALGALVDDRNEIIHAGQPPTRTRDFQLLYELFCRLVIKLADDVHRLDSTQSNYVTRYFDDLRAQPR